MKLKYCVIGFYDSDKQWWSTDPFDCNNVQTIIAKTKKLRDEIGTDSLIDFTITFDEDSAVRENPDRVSFGQYSVRYHSRSYHKWATYNGKNCEMEFETWIQAIEYCIVQTLWKEISYYNKPT